MANSRMDSIDTFRKFLNENCQDVVQELVRVFAQVLMSAEADALCGADFGARSETRVNCRNGYRHREWDTRAGTIDLAIPKLRKGAYFPSWLLEPRLRSEKALANVIAESYVLGVSTRRVDSLVRTMGIDGISKSQVSGIARKLDGTVSEFRNRPLDAMPYPFIWVDGISIKTREGGRVVNVSVVVATAVNADGHREILGLDVFTDEDYASWLTFLRSLVGRGLDGVKLVISDAHEGLKKAIQVALPGAAWQRCRTHFMTNLLTKVPRASQSAVATVVRTIFAQPDSTSVKKQFDIVADHFAEKLPQLTEMLEAAEADILAFASFPKNAWRQIWSNNPLERLNKEIRRRTDVVGIFPNRDAIIRLVGAVLAETNDEWAISRRYMSIDVISSTITTPPEPDNPEPLALPEDNPMTHLPAA